MSDDTFLTQAEIDKLCEPLTQPAAQVRFLRASGVHVVVKPNGRPAIVRAHVATVFSGAGQDPAAPTRARSASPDAEGPKPNVSGFMQVIQGGRKSGSKTKIKSAESA